MSQSIIRSYREAGQLAVAKVRELSIDIATDDAAKRRDMLIKCAMTSMNSKLVRSTTPQSPPAQVELTNMTCMVEPSIMWMKVTRVMTLRVPSSSETEH